MYSHHETRTSCPHGVADNGERFKQHGAAGLGYVLPGVDAVVQGILAYTANIPCKEEHAHSRGALPMLCKPFPLGVDGTKQSMLPITRTLCMPRVDGRLLFFFGLKSRSQSWGSATPTQLIGGLAVLKYSITCGCNSSHPIKAANARGGVRYSAGIVSILYR